MNEKEKECYKLAVKFKVFIKTRSIDPNYQQILVGEAVEKEDFDLLEEFKKENFEVFSLLEDLVSSVSVNEIDVIGLLDKDKGVFASFGDDCLYFTINELGKMLLNHNLFKKAQRIYCDLLRGNGFKCLIMT